MQDEVTTENAESVQTTAEVEVENVAEEQSELVETPNTNISPDDFVNSRINKTVQEPEPTPELEEAKEEAEPETDVLSKVDLDDMSDAELKELSEKLGSRAVARFGELTAKRKAAEERLKALEQEVSKKKRTKQVSQSDLADNPYKEIKNAMELQAKAKEVSDVLEWAEETLYGADSFSPSDVVAQLNNKDVTKSEVRDILKNARKAQKKHIPQQAAYLRSVAQGKQLEQGFVQKARTEIPWTNDNDSEVNKRYKAMLSDKRLTDSLKSADPSLKAQMPYILAHAANSMYGERKLVDMDAPVKPSKSITPPKPVGNAAAISEKPVKKGEKLIRNIKSNFATSGSAEDFIKLRAAQMSR